MWKIPEFCSLALANHIVFVAKPFAGMLMVIMQMHGSFATGWVHRAVESLKTLELYTTLNSCQVFNLMVFSNCVVL